MLVVDMDGQGLFIQAHLVTILTAYSSFYLTSVNWVFPFLLGLVGTSWLLIRTKFPLLPVLMASSSLLA